MHKKRLWAAVVLVGLVALGIWGAANLRRYRGVSTTTSATQATQAAAANIHPRVQSGITLSLITEPDNGITPIMKLIQKASTSIDLAMYELQDDSLETALAAAETRGVAVRVLLNQGYYGVPSNGEGGAGGANTAAYDYLQSAGVAVHWTPSYFALTHEKSLIVDGAIAAIMTFNFTAQYYATSRDFGIIDHDTNDIGAIEAVFNADWQGTSGQSGGGASNGVPGGANTPTGDDLIWSPDSEATLLAMIAGAQKSLAIYNEEMADDDVTDALVAAAVRGVAVDVIMTYSSEWRTAFKKLAAAGVHVRTYAGGTNVPLYIHAKMIIADSAANDITNTGAIGSAATAFLGSENFSYTSLTKNRELGILFADPKIIKSLSATFNADWQNAQPFVIH